jgi:hypothetical protein
MSAGVFLDPVFSSFENKKDETTGVEQMRKRAKAIQIMLFFRLMSPTTTQKTKRVYGDSNAGSILCR